LRNTDPTSIPLINPDFCGDKEGYDWKISMEGFKWGRKILAAEAFAPFIKSEFMPGVDVQDENQVRKYIKEWSKTDYHPVGSCKMGNDEMAVVDTQLRVHGLKGLRVIDASIMPTLISGNTQAPSIMIGEKGAAIVLAGELV
jgi:choline dehydrogenase-like flavoprotein